MPVFVRHRSRRQPVCYYMRHMVDVRKFTNEHGNEIQIQVSRKEVDGTPGVHIFLAGPASDTEVHITRREAEILHEELGRAL